MDYTALIVLACIFIPLERLLPLHAGQKVLRRDWLNDVFYMLCNGFVVRGGSMIVLGLALYGWSQLVPAGATAGVRALPVWAQVILAILVADIGYYTAHRLSHRIPFLWRFHAVHHSVEEMDWLATHRVHPLDQIFTNTLSFLPIFCLGFSTEAVAIHAVIYQAHALLLHSNLRLKFGPLKWLIASPEYHHWHHANQREAYDRNFAAQLSLIDLVAGTIFLPSGRRPERYGVSDPVPRFYPQQFLYPIIANIRALQQGRASKDQAMRKTQSTDAARPGLEDRLGMLAMLLVFGWLALGSARDLLQIVLHHRDDPMWLPVVITRLAGLSFLGLVVWFTATRLPARDVTHGIVPRVVAVVGTYVMMSLALLAPQSVGPVQQLAAMALSLLGLLLSSICLFRLGRSFAIAPAARRLVTSGPYRIVRHPLYAAELVAMAGTVLAAGSWAAFGVFCLWLGLQVLRARYEEEVLSRAFPEYHAYASRVPMLVPGLALFVPGGLRRMPEAARGPAGA